MSREEKATDALSRRADDSIQRIFESLKVMFDDHDFVLQRIVTGQIEVLLAEKSMQDLQVEVVRHVHVLHVMSTEDIIAVGHEHGRVRDEIREGLHDIPTSKTRKSRSLRQLLLIIVPVINPDQSEEHARLEGHRCQNGPLNPKRTRSSTLQRVVHNEPFQAANGFVGQLMMEFIERMNCLTQKCQLLLHLALAVGYVLIEPEVVVKLGHRIRHVREHISRRFVRSEETRRLNVVRRFIDA